MEMSPTVSPGANPSTIRVAVAATFTAEPIEPALRFWLDLVGLEGDVVFAPYNQVLPQLLDPSSTLGRNTRGVNVVLVRLEDWSRFLEDGPGEESVLDRGVEELSGALHDHARRSPTPVLLCVCPPSPGVSANPERAALHASMEARLKAAICDCTSIHWLEFDASDVGQTYDARRDEIGHMPYTPMFDVALATALARRVQAIRTPRPKVIALDCDNTLWKGVVGEDGPLGVSVPPGLWALQEFVVQRQEEGMVVCLLSKNVEDDVLAVFDARPDMPLKRETIVAMRVNWLPKSANITALAAELNLGLDSVVFIDDNPVECAEMRVARPEVLTLELPAADEEIPAFLQNVWAFDILTVTDEDRARTFLYRENAERNRFEQQAGSIASFLAGLELRVDICPPTDDQLPRVAQLTQKTNQFNFTTVRRSEAEVRQLGWAGLECLRVNVADRFGDYGLVGVIIIGTGAEGLEIDTLLLSCRVLGRGVEHAMLAHIGRLALERGLGRVDARFVPSSKNLPAAGFLESVGATYRGEDSVYRFPAAVAAAVHYVPGSDAQDQLERAREMPKATAAAGTPARDKSSTAMRIATELRSPAAVLQAVERWGVSGRPDLETPFVGPRNDLERSLAALWERVLGIDRVGVLDDFSALGGTSLKAAYLFAAIDEQLGKQLPLTTILDAPTVERLAALVAGDGGDGPRESLKHLRPGGPGPAFFLVHDGHGETLLYMNLARRLPADVAVYGIEPLSTGRSPILHTRVPDMAAHYLREIRRVQPEGPYLLGGMCAGGTIAFEIALQLEAQGESVGLVALLDPAAPRAERRLGVESSRRRARLSQALQEAHGSGPLRRIAAKAGKVLKKIQGYTAYQVTSRAEAIATQVKFRMLRSATDAGRPAPKFAHGLAVQQVYNRAEAEYQPAGSLNAPAVLFRATEGTGDLADEPFITFYTDPLLGWGRWVTGDLELCAMPGGHSSMLQEPHVAVMAERLKACMSRLHEPAEA
jgi:FkbH-like protein